MSSPDAVAAARAAITSLAAATLLIRNEYGDTLGVRRLTADVDRIQAALDDLGPPKPGHQPATNKAQMLQIPDEPYDESMWHDAESEAQRVQ